MWPSVAYIVEERRLGTAYAVMFLIQQLGVAGMNWIIGRTNDAFEASAANPMGHAPGMWIFSVLGFLALLFLQGAVGLAGGPGAEAFHGNAEPFLTHTSQELVFTIGLVFISFAGPIKRRSH